MTRPYTATELNNTLLMRPESTDGWGDFVFANSSSWPSQNDAVESQIVLGNAVWKVRIWGEGRGEATLATDANVWLVVYGRAIGSMGEPVGHVQCMRHMRLSIRHSWQVFLEPRAGWRPAWEQGLLAAAVLGSALIALLVGTTLASWVQQKRLLSEVTASHARLSDTSARLQEEKLRLDALLVRQFNLMSVLLADRGGGGGAAAAATAAGVGAHGGGAGVERNAGGADARDTSGHGMADSLGGCRETLTLGAAAVAAAQSPATTPVHVCVSMSTPAAWCLRCYDCCSIAHRTSSCPCLRSSSLPCLSPNPCFHIAALYTTRV